MAGRCHSGAQHGEGVQDPALEAWEAQLANELDLALEPGAGLFGATLIHVKEREAMAGLDLELSVAELACERARGLQVPSPIAASPATAHLGPREESPSMWRKRTRLVGSLIVSIPSGA